MAIVYIRSLDFHLASEEEAEEIEGRIQKKNYKKWFRRMIFFFLITVICVVFQIFARISVPYMFSKNDTVEKLILMGVTFFFAANGFSWIELLLEKSATFDLETTKVAKLRVRRKIYVENLIVMRQQKWFVICETDEGLIEDIIIVRGKADYNNIKEGEMIYVQRAKDNGHYLYFYIA